MTESSPDIAVIILSHNEAVNLPQALNSVCGWAREVFVLDSYSTDDTVNIARQAGCHIGQNRFEDYAKQRNFALTALPIQSAWILFLDADEWLSEALKQEITDTLQSHPEENGFYLKWRMIWMGRWIKRGYYPTWILRLLRRGKGYCEDRPVNEHLLVEGKLGYLQQDFIHEDHKSLDAWISKHLHYARREALELLKQEQREQQVEIPASLWGTQAERKRWLRYRLWNRLPPLIRPWLYFVYRYIICGGFLDGKEAFIYHFLQALWAQMMIDINYLELKRQQDKAK